ncbi:MAG TPA: tetratricopeptide repeat protein [Candidatus Omnitrophota bacterium]|nr:tetratricopeptide repeat protein [Candidatus Omnitrophota bacterium]
MNWIARPLIFLSLAAFLLIPSAGTFAAERAWDELDLQATLLFRDQKYDEALPVAEQALRVAETKYGPKSPQRLVSMNFLAYLSRKTGDYGRARTLYGEVLGLLEKVYGPDDPRTAAARQRYESVVSLAKDEAPR